jgi:subtilisin-like proprotein convertase family protein
MKRLLLHSWLFAVCGLVQLAGPSAKADLITGVSNPNLTIPDNDPNGVANTISLSTPITSIASLSMTLNIVGGYNGDFYAYLRHGASGFAVLLNRAGQTGANLFGYADSGFNVTFSDLAANGDIHAYVNVVDPAGGTLTGLWQPDARFDGLSNVRGATFNSFNGLDPNGDWTLFVADLSPVGIGTLANWSLTIEGAGPSVAAPDGGSTLALASAALVILAGLNARWQPQARRNLPETR